MHDGGDFLSSVERSDLGCEENASDASKFVELARFMKMEGKVGDLN